jgi:hypothetical protein
MEIVIFDKGLFQNVGTYLYPRIFGVRNFTLALLAETLGFPFMDHPSINSSQYFSHLLQKSLWRTLPGVGG